MLAAISLAVACDGPQSALAPAGAEADRLSDLFWAMTIGAVVIWAAVVALSLYAVYFRKRAITEKAATRLVVGGGVIFPTVVLAGLLVYGLAMLPGLLEPAPQGSLRVHVVGNQFWWRVRYERPGAKPVELANEIRLPAGQPVDFILESQDVIHSFWIPSLGGKMDMIPGRTTRLTLRPLKQGVYRGTCAEYCGASHALMAFAVVVEEPAAFDRWLSAQAAPAAPPSTAAAARGRDVFLSSGCGACHTVRGTAADGVTAPDLTHVGGRRTIAAGILETTPDRFTQWVSHPERIKPGVWMPHFTMLPEAERVDLGVFLAGLE